MGISLYTHHARAGASETWSLLSLPSSSTPRLASYREAYLCHTSVHMCGDVCNRICSAVHSEQHALPLPLTLPLTLRARLQGERCMCILSASDARRRSSSDGVLALFTERSLVVLGVCRRHVHSCTHSTRGTCTSDRVWCSYFACGVQAYLKLRLGHCASTGLSCSLCVVDR